MPSAGLNHLTAFVAVAERGGFARAAGALGRLIHVMDALLAMPMLATMNNEARA